MYSNINSLHCLELRAKELNLCFSLFRFKALLFRIKAGTLNEMNFHFLYSMFLTVMVNEFANEAFTNSLTMNV